MADIEIGYKGSTITSINSGGVTTLNTIGTFCEDNITVTFNKTQGEAFTPATTITTNPSITLSATTGTITAFYSGASNITPTVTPGYVSAGTAGTVRTSGTSTYQLSTVAAQTITPTTASQLAVASGRFTTGSVYVGAIPSTYVQPTGTLTISTNGTYDVTEYASVSTNISEGERFAPIYKNLAYRNILCANGSSRATYGSYTASDVTDWCDSLSMITYGQFANQIFSGSFSFNNVSIVSTYAFGSVYTNVGYSTTISCVFDFPACTYISNAVFYQNQILGKIDLPIVSQIPDSAFYYCSKLSAINAESCQSIGSHAFELCTRLTTASFSQCSTIGSSAFNNCSSMTTVDLPLCTSIGSYAFAQCIRLTSVNLPLCPSIPTLAFNSCYSLNTITLPSCTLVNYGAFSGCRSLSFANLPECQIISASAFYYCSKLQEINLPLCTLIGSNAFYACYSLQEINLPLCTSVGGSAFYSCKSLQEINLPLCTSIGSYAFASCSNLTTITLPSCLTIGYSAFTYCVSLNTVILPLCTSIGANAFNGCSSLFSVYLLNSSIVSLYDYTAFSATPISASVSGVYGSIFVRASLYDSYLTTRPWSYYSSRFVSLTDAEIEALGF